MITLAITLALLQQSQTPASCCTPNGMALFAGDPSFVASHLEPKPFNYAPVAGGHMVSFKDSAGKAAEGFFVPANKGVNAAVVLVHEWWGLNGYMTQHAEQIHNDLGVAVLAIDLYEGKSTSDRNEAGKLMGSVDNARAKAICAGAVDALYSGELGLKHPKIGSVGYCFGGGWSFWVAAAGGDKVEACVIYYGSPDFSGIPSLKAPVLLIHPKEDKWINDDLISKFNKAMEADHKKLTVLNYDADHAFANPSNPGYKKKEAADAWSHAAALFRKQLMLNRNRPY